MDSTKVEELKEKIAERELIIREQWVKAMEFRIVQGELSKCQRTEGVNHYENCRVWSKRYLDMLQGSKITGFRHIDV